MPAFGFSVGDVIATIELIRKLLGGLKKTTGAAAQYQRTIIELESLCRVLRYVEKLEVNEHENAGCIDSLRAAAFATSLTLGDFLCKLSKYEASLAPSGNMHKIKRGAGALRWTLSMDNEVDRLQLYVAGQMLCINTLLRLLERESAEARESQRRAEYENVMNAMTDQATAIGVVKRNVIPMNKNFQDYEKTVESLAKTSYTNAEILVRLQQRIFQSPSTSARDSILLNDVLGRSFLLPYVYFDQWEMLESFIKQTFRAIDTPGTKQVQNGRYFVSPSNHDSKILNKANWSSNIFPGAELTMTIVLSMLKMPLQRCPKPSCGQHVPDVTEMREFITCQACGLHFRFNPDTEQLGVNTHDEIVHLIHEDEDSSKFGRRHMPPDVFEVESEEFSPPEQASLSATLLPMVDMELKDPSSKSLTSENLLKLGLLSSEKIGNDKNHFVGLEFSQLPSVDWNSGPSGMAAWLNSSAAPAHNSEYLGPIPDTFQMNIEQLRQEKKDIESLRRVHFVSTVPESKPLKDTVEEYQTMPLNTQIYVRKIVDRFPTVPSFLAKRFAHANADRLNRLRDRTHNTLEEDPPPRIALKSKTWTNLQQSASPIRTENKSNFHEYVMMSSQASQPISDSPKSRERHLAEIAGRQGRFFIPDSSEPRDVYQSEHASNDARSSFKPSPDPPSRAIKPPMLAPRATVRPHKLTRVNARPRNGHLNGQRTEQVPTQNSLHAQGNKRKTYICVDVSPNAKMLADCLDCRDGKIYEGYHKATAHLRKRHFDLQRKSDHKLGGPQSLRAATPIRVLKQYIKVV